MTMTGVYGLFIIAVVLYVADTFGVFERIAWKLHKRKINKAVQKGDER